MKNGDVQIGVAFICAAIFLNGHFIQIGYALLGSALCLTFLQCIGWLDK